MITYAVSTGGQVPLRDLAPMQEELQGLQIMLQPFL